MIKKKHDDIKRLANKREEELEKVKVILKPKSVERN
jgi:hypothetical protein